MTNEDEDFLNMIEGLRRGQPEAAEKLWDEFSGMLENYARRKLGGLPRRASDEEDVMLSAFADFTEGVRRDQFPDLSSKQNLVRVLFVIANRKAKKRIRYHNALIRGGGDVRGESAFMTLDGEGGGLGEVQGGAAMSGRDEAFTQDCIELLDSLDNDQQRTIAILRLQGHGTNDIARDLGVSGRTVERALARIREIWLPIEG